MQSFLLRVVLGLAAIGVEGKEMAVDNKVGAELYESGIMHHRIMDTKHTTWERARQAGRMNSSQYPSADHYVACEDGVAAVIPGDVNYTFRCHNIDFYSFMSHADLGSQTGEGSSSWGWTSPEGREFIAIAQADGAAFAEITSEGKLVYLARLPPVSENSIWREIRGYKDYMVIGSEADFHGIQIFDMRKLLTIDPQSPVTYDAIKDLTGFYDKLPIGRTHNVVVNPETDFIYAVGAVPRNDKCRSGLIFINMTNPANPVSPGCASADGYVHDAQGVIYKGPQKKYQGREIVFGFNENSFTIYDVTNKKAPKILSRTSYEGAAYVHQGWLLNEDMEYLLMDDELDEMQRVGPAADGIPVTYVWDIRDLEHPKNTGTYKGTVMAIDHNQYIHDMKSYQSNYGAGFRIMDVSSIPEDPTGGSVDELGFFDVYPEDDLEEGGGKTEFLGSWSSYAYFKSGYIFVNSIERGGFVLKYRES